MRALRAEEQDMKKTRSLLAKLQPQTRDLLTSKQQQAERRLCRTRGILLGEAEKLRVERACLRGRTADVLLRQGDGDFGPRRIPIDPAAEPFLHSAIVHGGYRAALHGISPARAPSTRPEAMSRGPVNLAKNSQGGDLLFDVARGALGAKDKKLEALDQCEKQMQRAAAPFLQQLRMVTLASWRDRDLEQADGLERLDDLPRFNHQLLPLLCADANSRRKGPPKQIRIPSTAIMRGNVCAHWIENNELNHPVAKLHLADLQAHMLGFEFERIAPAGSWPLNHGAFIAKRLKLDGAGEQLRYAMPATNRVTCFCDCVTPVPLQDGLGTHSTVAVPATAADLQELLRALKFVAPDTITVVQEFVRCHGGTSQVCGPAFRVLPTLQCLCS